MQLHVLCSALLFWCKGPSTAEHMASRRVSVPQVASNGDKYCLASPYTCSSDSVDGCLLIRAA